MIVITKKVSLAAKSTTLAGLGVHLNKKHYFPPFFNLNRSPHDGF